MFFTTQYSSLSYKIKRIINKNWGILDGDPSLRQVFSERPLFSFRRAPTLKDRLMKSYFPASKPPPYFPKPKGTYRCGSCNHCENISRQSAFLDVFSEKVYYCKHFANCNTTHVVYRLECGCGCFYIGRTKRRLRDRLAEHKYAIRTQNPSYPMAVHFREAGHTDLSSVKIMAIEVINKNIRGGDRLKRLLQRETWWIVKLNATTFPGLNDDVDFSPFL